jgi:hypothetical protein
MNLIIGLEIKSIWIKIKIIKILDNDKIIFNWKCIPFLIGKLKNKFAHIKFS